MAARFTPLVVLVCVIAIGAALVLGRSGSRPRRAWVCVTTNGVTGVAQWSGMLGREVNCAVVFADAASTWSQWAQPWVLSYRRNWPAYDWVDWLAAGRGRRHLIVTIGLIPSAVRTTNWLLAGAQGQLRSYDRALAANLVRAGLGGVVIRLGHEANGTWYPDSIPGTAAGDAEWIRTWRNTVQAMRSVPGAKFRFDWTVNAGYRSIPLASFYPGDDVVNVIGVDAYDNIVSDYRGPRLRALFSQPDGLSQVEVFARRHHKLMSVAEWGLGPNVALGKAGGAGDDPAYVNALARIFASGAVLYQSYFAGGTQGPELLHSPASLAAYRRHFGRGGSAAS